MVHLPNEPKTTRALFVATRKMDGAMANGGAEKMAVAREQCSFLALTWSTPAAQSVDAY